LWRKVDVCHLEDERNTFYAAALPIGLTKWEFSLLLRVSVSAVSGKVFKRRRMTESASLSLQPPYRKPFVSWYPNFEEQVHMKLKVTSRILLFFRLFWDTHLCLNIWVKKANRFAQW
jgi:hypothetical protein